MDSGTVDSYDLAILRELERNGRISWVALAEAVNLSPTACQRRVRLLEERGVIRSYGARIDVNALGYTVEAFVAVRVERQSTDLARQFRAAIAAYPQVRSCHLLSGDTDFLLRVVARDLRDFGSFIQEKILNLPGIEDASSLIVLETVKEDGAALP